MPAKGMCQDLSNYICTVLNRIRVIHFPRVSNFVVFVVLVLNCFLESINMSHFVHVDTLAKGLNDFSCTGKIACS